MIVSTCNVSRNAPPFPLSLSRTSSAAKAGFGAAALAAGAAMLLGDAGW